jgi:hypothetical protein
MSANCSDSDSDSDSSDSANSNAENLLIQQTKKVDDFLHSDAATEFASSLRGVFASENETKLKKKRKDAMSSKETLRERLQAIGEDYHPFTQKTWEDIGCSYLVLYYFVELMVRSII